MKAAALLAFLSVLALSALPHTWAAEAPPDGPRTLTENDIDAWIAEKLDPTGWRYLYFDGDGAYFISPDDRPWRTQEGTWRATLREELFRPDARGARSMILEAEVDCDARKLRLPGIEAFSRHNLKGDRVVRDPIQAWVAPETAGEEVQFHQLCAAAKSIASASIGEADATLPPASLAPADLRDWAERYLDLSGWRVVEAARDGLNLVTPDGVTRTGGRVYRLWTRIEFFHPEAYPAGGPPALSARQRVELDCSAVRWRIVRVEAFRQHNFKGPEPPLQAPAAPWISPAARAAEPQMIRQLCQLAEAAVPAPTAPASSHRRHHRPHRHGRASAAGAARQPQGPGGIPGDQHRSPAP